MLLTPFLFTGLIFVLGFPELTSGLFLLPVAPDSISGSPWLPVSISGFKYAKNVEGQRRNFPNRVAL